MKEVRANNSIAHAKNTSVEGVIRAGVGESSGCKFHLFGRSELDAETPDWDPASDTRLTVWEALQPQVARLQAGAVGVAGSASSGAPLPTKRYKAFKPSPSESQAAQLLALHCRFTAISEVAARRSRRRRIFWRSRLRRRPCPPARLSPPQDR